MLVAAVQVWIRLILRMILSEGLSGSYIKLAVYVVPCEPLPSLHPIPCSDWTTAATGTHSGADGLAAFLTLIGCLPSTHFHAATGPLPLLGFPGQPDQFIAGYTQLPSPPFKTMQQLDHCRYWDSLWYALFARLAKHDVQGGIGLVLCTTVCALLLP